MPPHQTATPKPGSPTEQPPAGTLLAGRFEVLRPREGGVLLGRDIATRASVVITAVDAGLVSPAAAGLIDRHVAELAGLPGGAGPVHAGRDGGWYILVAPLVHGVPLAERLVHGPLSPEATLDVARDALRALTVAHQRHLAHLSVSPATVMVNPGGPVRSATLVGFGAAGLRDCLTGEPGDLRYAAPERAGVLDRPVDHRADLYSLGLVLHECLGGRPAVVADTDGELLRRRLTDRPPGLRGERPEVPAELEAEILRMLAVEPADRPADAGAVLAALEGVGSRAPRRGQGRPPGGGELLGRSSELAELAARVGAAAAGRASAVLLEGPAGSGKTRLLDELCREAGAQGAIVLRGRAPVYPPAPAAALDGVVGRLGDLARRDPEVLARLRAVAAGVDATALCTLFPPLRSLLGLPDHPTRPRGAPPARWAGAPILARALAAAGGPGAPVLVVLDDCQWADVAVLELVAAWSGAAGPGAAHHATLVAAYRSDGLEADHPLRQTAAIGRLALGRLDDRDVIEIARAAGAPAGPAADRVVLASAAGNPARAELAAACLHEAGGEPASLPADLAARRVETLPDAVHKLLCAGALLGRDFPLDLAAAMLGRGDTWTEVARADAERRLLVVSADAGERLLSFRHDGVREALLGGVPLAERRRLHARACDVLAQAGSVYGAAWHALACGDRARAMARALAAARAANARQAPDVAEHYLREARRQAGVLDPGQSLEIVEDLAAVHLAQGRPDLAEEQLTAAARLAHEPVHQAAISASLARLGASRGDHAAASAAAEAAISSRGGHLPGSSAVLVGAFLLVELLVRLRPRCPRSAADDRSTAAAAAGEYALLARCYADDGRRLAGAWAALRALRLAESSAPSPRLVECQTVHAQLLRDAGRHRRAVAAAAAAERTAAALGDDELTAGALLVAGELLYAAGMVAAAAERFERSAALAGGPDAPAAQAAVLGAGFCAYRLGAGDRAREIADLVRRRALTADSGELAGAALGLWLKAGGAPGPTGDRADARPASVARLEARGLELLAAGELEAAIGVLERATAEPAAGDPEALASARAWLAGALRLAAEDGLGGDPRVAARRAVRAARASRTNLPQALREQGRIDAVAGRTRRARGRLRRSLRVAERQAAAAEVDHTLAATRELGLAAGGTGAAGALGRAEPVRVERPERTPAPAFSELAPVAAATPSALRPEPAAGRRAAAPAAGAASIDARLATLLIGGRGISAALSRDAIFDAVREVAAPLLQGERVVIVHISGGPGDPLVSGYSPACDESLARVCRSLAERAAARGEVVAVAAAEPGIGRAMMLRGGVGAAICAPICFGERVNACIYVDRPERAEPFGPEEHRLAEFVAGMAATSLENAEGFAKVETLSRSLEQRVEERTAQLADSNRQLDLSLQRLTEAFERERESAAELKHQAFHDPLTDLANRALFVDRVEHALEVARRAGHGVAVLFVDLDDFKTVNDSLGHPAGDELLVEVAARLREVLRRADTAARLGGDEFGILLEGIDRAGAARTAERILASLDIPFKLAAKEVFVHASIGIALRGDEEISVDSLLRNADVAMYIAKTGGKHAYEVFQQRMHDEIVRRLELKDDLHRGIELHQFVVHYQPIVDIAANRIHGLEALVRWNHPVHGMVSPLDFVPLAEETGLIRAIGDWVLRTACEATRGWQLEAGHEGDRLTIAVNLSARELHEPGLVDCVAAALRGSGLAPADLTLEITESVLMNDTDAAIARLGELKALGVRLAIDDFGTGYSSLSYLKHLPVDIVKIDKEFVDDIARGPQEAALAGTIVALSETLRLKTVAEGIEDADQLRALRRLGCDYGQGYLFARPAAAAATGALLGGDRGFPELAEPGVRHLRAV